MVTAMVEWLKRLVVGQGNVIRERAYTNWNTLDVDAIVAEKEREAGIVRSDTSGGTTFSVASRKGQRKPNAGEP